MKCDKCGQETYMPFQCPYCGGRYCANHRLPEAHSCPKLNLARAPGTRNERITISQVPYQYTVTYGNSSAKTAGRFYFGPKELKHLLISALLVFGIGLSIYFYENFSRFGGLNFSLVFALLLMLSFLVHEIAHKFMAQSRGLWAEFRLTTWGVVITFLSIIIPFKLIAPGAVMISGYARGPDIGKISIAGPAVNMLFSVSFMATAQIDLFGWSPLILWLAFFNGFLAVFNLIPFGALDGYKIYNWDKKIWVLTFSAAAALTIISALTLSGIGIF